MEKKNKYYFYVLQCVDKSFYGGFTTDVKKRLETHNAGKGAKYTKTRRPVKLLYFEEFDNKHDALSAEYKFKHQSRQKKEIFLRQHQVSWVK